MFRSRTTGRITLAQLPSWPLAVRLLASAVMWPGTPKAGYAVLVVLASAALALGAGDEVMRGVNPFCRLLGFAMLAWLGFSLVDSLDDLSRRNQRLRRYTMAWEQP